jgi:hypothetical protein
MKYATERLFADSEKAARRLMEHAQAFEPRGRLAGRAARDPRVSRQPRDAGGDPRDRPREDRAPAAAATPASTDLELQVLQEQVFPEIKKKMFHRAPKSCSRFFPPRALIRHGYLQADTKHCLRAEGH